MKKILLFATLFATVSHTFSRQTISKTQAKDYSLSNNKAQQQQFAANDTTPVFTVGGKIALHALMSIGDAHLVKIADALKVLANSEAARSADWKRMQHPLATVALTNVPAVYWFCLPDGTYWTLDHGRETARLSDRQYFPGLMAGQPVMGQLVVSHSTNRNTAIVAVPVRGEHNSILGAVGCSVYLDSLSNLVRDQMGGLGDELFFYSFDAEPLVALHSDPTIIFIEPMKQEDEGLQQAFRQMLSGREGEVKYVFRGVRRTVIYSTSPITGWWYGLGRIEH